MGGGYDNGFSSNDQRRVEEKAKEKLKEAVADTSRHVFISFANEDHTS